jgi:hypothetical protein
VLDKTNKKRFMIGCAGNLGFQSSAPPEPA